MKDYYYYYYSFNARVRSSCKCIDFFFKLLKRFTWEVNFGKIGNIKIARTGCVLNWLWYSFRLFRNYEVVSFHRMYKGTDSTIRDRMRLPVPVHAIQASRSYFKPELFPSQRIQFAWRHKESPQDCENIYLVMSRKCRWLVRALNANGCKWASIIASRNQS